MKFDDDYRDHEKIDKLLVIANVTTQSWTLMEICGGQTHSIVKYGLDQWGQWKRSPHMI